MRALRWTFASSRAWAVAAGLFVGYAALYLLVAKALIVDPHAQFSRFGALPSLTLAPLSAGSFTDWIAPVFLLYISDSVLLAPSAPAILTVLVLGGLVGVNGAIGVEAIVRRPRACATGGGPWWIAAVIPSFLASFSCCAPTVLLLVGGATAAAVISVVPFVVPAAALLLLLSLAWSAQRLERTTVLASA